MPKYWLETFSLFDDALQEGKNQGNFNGPDYIFKDLNNRLIGLEIVSYSWNLHRSFKSHDFAIKFAKNNIYNLSNFNERVNEFKEILRNKNKKVDNYLKTEKVYLGIVVLDSLMDYEYYFLELILEKYIKEINIKFDGVFIL